MPAPAEISKPRYNGAGSEYRLVPGDKIKLTIFGEPDLSGDFGVDGAGLIALPLVGPMRAQGLTLEQFQVAARRRFANGYLKNPRISAEITSFRPIFVHGEVRSGGEFSYKEGLRFRDAIAMAGGYTYRAEPSYVLLTRDGSPEVRLALPARARVRPGDNIRVPERFF